jgi:hypothetical protein
MKPNRRQLPTLIRIGIALAVMLPVSAGCTVHSPSESDSSHSSADWNDASPLLWVTGLAEDQDRFESLASVQSFERLQATIEEVKQPRKGPRGPIFRKT